MGKVSKSKNKQKPAKSKKAKGSKSRKHKEVNPNKRYEYSSTISREGARTHTRNLLIGNNAILHLHIKGKNNGGKVGGKV
jgi:hypothetical protein